MPELLKTSEFWVAAATVALPICGFAVKSWIKGKESIHDSNNTEN